MSLINDQKPKLNPFTIVDNPSLHSICDSHHYNDILMIGDPHTCSVAVSTRIDKDFAKLTTGKLKWSLDYAKENNLLPIILGDLFTISDDNNIELLALVMSIVRDHPNALCLVGNHDKSEHTTFNEHDIMSIFAASGLMNLVNQSGFIGHFNIAGKPLAIGASPYGFDIPNKVESDHETLWLTHHDLNFDPRFAKISCFEIEGCLNVFNGHLHKTFSPIIMGHTTWYNQGNIFRMSRTEKDHVPSVWIWNPSVKPKQVIVPHVSKVFIETPVDIEPRTINEVERKKVVSTFVAALKADTEAEAMLTSDGSLLDLCLDAAIEKFKPNAETLNIVKAMLQESVNEVK